MVKQFLGAMHTIQVIMLLLVIPIGGFLLYAQHKDVSLRDMFTRNANIVKIGDVPLTVEIVATQEARTRGLSGRTDLKTSGMLFVFDTADYHGIWMKDMYFPIDIIWVDEALTVVGIRKGVQPNTYPEIFRPPVKVRYIIETKERYVDTLGIAIGDEVRLPELPEDN